MLNAHGADGREIGSVTVDTSVRWFALAICQVRRPWDADKDRYHGRGWQAQLFTDALEELKRATIR
ncbi:hypothetical protein [Paraburkholderia youngii]|uniref:hypothetical protein n=1 Tax=Paraburkholderia youngii TaxID=2782701 RepID=UPI003D1E0516